MARIVWFDGADADPFVERLRQEGHSVNHYWSFSDDEIALLRGQSVDLIVTEISFEHAHPDVRDNSPSPSEAGLYLLEQLCAQGSANKGTRKFVLSSVGDEGVMAKAYSLIGMLGNYTVKPADFDQYMEELHKVLGTD